MSLLEKTDRELDHERQLAVLRRANRPRYNAELAAVMSLVIPGTGQLYVGERGLGMLMLGTSIATWKLVVPWVICALIGCFLAFRKANELNGRGNGL